MFRQLTLKSSARASGVGIHSGQRVQLSINPAPINTGIVFRRVDLPAPLDIKVNAHHITDTRMATTLCAGLSALQMQHKVATIEHLMSALFGLGVDNAIIEVDATEIPILDGSAGSFVYLVQSVGLVEQNAPKQFFEVLKPIEVSEGGAWARLAPHFGFKLSFSIDFGHPAIDATGQTIEMDFSQVSYVQEIARARTFGFMQDVDTMRSRGLALGGSFENAIVMDESKVLNGDGLRYSDEFAKHKILDAIGDLYVLGHPLLASYSSHKGGHRLNNLLLRALLEDHLAWRMVQFTDTKKAPKVFRQDWVAV